MKIGDQVYVTSHFIIGRVFYISEKDKTIYVVHRLDNSSTYQIIVADMVNVIHSRLGLDLKWKLEDIHSPMNTSIPTESSKSNTLGHCTNSTFAGIVAGMRDQLYLG